MDRETIFAYADKIYKTKPEYLWARDPDSAVLRHRENNKWYAIVMKVEGDRLGLSDSEKVDIINVKCEPDRIGVLQMTKGILPGYHMNKNHWITILLDGSVDENMIYNLLDYSFELTAGTGTGRRRGGNQT